MNSRKSLLVVPFLFTAGVSSVRCRFPAAAVVIISFLERVIRPSLEMAPRILTFGPLVSTLILQVKRCDHN
jgi:hypothetical protein